MNAMVMKRLNLRVCNQYDFIVTDDDIINAKCLVLLFFQQKQIPHELMLIYLQLILFLYSGVS